MNRRVEIFLQMDKRGTPTSLDMPLESQTEGTGGGRAKG